MGGADIEVPNFAVDRGSRAKLACYPRSSFYPLITCPSTRNACGSLSPAFASARHVCLTVRHPYAFVLDGEFPTRLRVPLDASVTLWEAAAPAKLPA